MRHEQLDGGTDIYSLGMVMYEAYTGDRFFAGMTETAIVGKVLYDPQENIPNFPDSTPAAFTALVTKAIAKSRQHRYQRISDFIHDLEFCQATLRESVVVVSSSQPNSTPEFSKATTTVAPVLTAPVEEKTVFQPLPREQKRPAPGPPITTKPVVLKTEEIEKAPPAAPTRRVEAKKAATSYVEPTMGDAPPEIVADANQDRWAIGEPHFRERPPMREKALASPSALRRSIPWVLALVGAALVGGLVFWLKPMLTPTQPPPQPIAAPVIVRVEPQTPAVRILEGEKVAFATQAEGAAPLQYTWTLDGQPVSQTAEWTYNPGVGDRSDTPKDVRVQITDRQGQAVERHWQVTVTYISKPPELQAFAPKKATVEVTSGTTQPFRIDVTDPDGETLTYAWTVNGEAAGTKATLNWNTEEPGNYQVRAVVTDPAGLTVRKDWQVKVVAAPPPPPIPTEPATVTNTPPQITQYAPDEALLTTQEGQSLSFSATVADPDGDQLTYEWMVDGKRVARGSSTARPTLTWKAKGAGNHVVRALVSDRAGLSAMREWQVAVVPSLPSTDTPPVTPPAADNLPPQITARTPDVDALKTSVGQTLAFEGVASDPDGDDLTYEWFVNGKKAAQGAKFAFAADEKGNPRIELQVTDTRGQKQRTRWEVEIGAASSVPRVVMFTPHQKRYVTYPHLSRFFSVDVEVPGEPEPELTYEWKVDGRAVRGDTLFELKDQPVGNHEVEVTATTSSGAHISHQWTVEVRKDEGDRAAIWSPQLEISGLTNSVSADKKTIIVSGKLRNVDQERATDNVIIWVTAINGRGQEVSRRMTLPSPQPIEPGRTANFQVQLSNRDDAVDFRVQVVSK